MGRIGRQRTTVAIHLCHSRADRAFRKLTECLMEGNRAWAATAPVLILTLAKTHNSRTNQPTDTPGTMWAWPSATSPLRRPLDLYVHNMAGFSAEKARQLFDLPPDIEPVTMIAVGYLGDRLLPDPLKERELAHRQRKTLDELILK